MSQLKIAKSSLRTQSQRDANKVASEQVIYYLENIVEKKDIIGQDLNQKDVDLLRTLEYDSENLYKINTDKMIEFDDKYIDEGAEKYIQDIQDIVTKNLDTLLNTLEAFSASVLSGVGMKSLFMIRSGSRS